MIWTDVIEMHEFEQRGWLYTVPPDEIALVYCDRRTAMLERRVELARLEGEAWRAMLSEKECVWAEDCDGGWETLCGGQFELTSGTPQSNGMAYCCYCGGSLEQIEYTDEAERAAIAATPTEEA